jgi:hypothetical protein
MEDRKKEMKKKKRKHKEKEKEKSKSIEESWRRRSKIYNKEVG